MLSEQEIDLSPGERVIFQRNVEGFLFNVIVKNAHGETVRVLWESPLLTHATRIDAMRSYALAKEGWTCIGFVAQKGRELLVLARGKTVSMQEDDLFGPQGQAEHGVSMRWTQLLSQAHKLLVTERGLPHKEAADLCDAAEYVPPWSKFIKQGPYFDAGAAVFLADWLYQHRDDPSLPEALRLALKRAKKDAAS